MLELLQAARRIVVHLYQRFFADRILQSAAALTYTTLFSVVPVMTVTFVMLAAIPAFRDLGDPIQAFIFHNFLPSAGEQIQQYLREFSSQARELTWIGVGMLMVTALLTLHTVEGAFNYIWRAPRLRRPMSSFLRYWAILSLGPLLLGAGFAASTYVTSLELLSGPHALPGVATLLNLVPLLSGIAAFTLLYAAVPNTRVPFRHALVGGCFAALLFEAAKALFALYVRLFPSYQLIYGAFSAVPLFLLWIYFTWLIVLMGAELTCHLGDSPHWRSSTRPALVNLLGLLAQLHACQRSGEALSRDGLARLGWGLGEDEWRRLIGFLERERVVSAVGNGEWVLCRDLSRLSLHELLLRWPEPLPASLPEHLPKPLEASWYPRLRAALQQLAQARGESLGGSLADWLAEPPRGE